eukprot:7405958-Ditylum_brightwellii.AAC.1
MSKPFNPGAPIKDLFKQINDGQDLAIAAEIPYSKMQLINKAYDLIFKTGVHNDVCKEWNRKPAADKTYANFQLHFTTAHRELHQLQIAAHQAGYYANSAANEEQEELQHRTAEALANFAEATTSDREAVSNLTETNLALTDHVAKLSKQL